MKKIKCLVGRSGQNNRALVVQRRPSRPHAGCLSCPGRVPAPGVSVPQSQVHALYFAAPLVLFGESVGGPGPAWRGRTSGQSVSVQARSAL